MSKVLYLQSDEKIAENFTEAFASQGVEMAVVKSGEEALEFIATQKVLLLLLDINISDMRLRKLIDRIRSISPQVIINVCVDVNDPLMITKLSNRHHVHKVYIAPWNMEEIIDEVKESLEVALINEQTNVKEDKILCEKNEFEQTLNSLKNTLKKQQYSYGRLLVLTEAFTDALKINAADEDAVKINQKTEFAKDICNAILKMQTTGRFEADKFGDVLKNDIMGLHYIANISTGEIKSCLFKGQSRVYAQNIRLCVYMIARLYAEFFTNVSIGITSHFTTVKEAEFIISVRKNTKKAGFDEALFSKYMDYSDSVINDMTREFSRSESDGAQNYYCTFVTSRD